MWIFPKIFLLGVCNNQHSAQSKMTADGKSSEARETSLTELFYISCESFFRSFCFRQNCYIDSAELRTHMRTFFQVCGLDSDILAVCGPPVKKKLRSIFKFPEFVLLRQFEILYTNAINLFNAMTSWFRWTLDYDVLK